ncbi:MAG: hypothetical protein VYC34_08015 [Planctomycetota bacterium]|nr:hypothetical protein [Planctomycetota bacterium]
MALFGVYGEHSPDRCPLVCPESAKSLHRFASYVKERNLGEWGIREIRGQYHAALEHTFIWIIEADAAHSLERFFIETGLVASNKIKIIPLITFEEDLVPMSARIHGL